MYSFISFGPADIRDTTVSMSWILWSPASLSHQISQCLHCNPSPLDSIYVHYPFSVCHLCKWMTTLRTHERAAVFHSNLGMRKWQDQWFIHSPPPPPTPTTNEWQTHLLKRSHSNFPQGLSSLHISNILSSLCSSPFSSLCSKPHPATRTERMPPPKSPITISSTPTSHPPCYWILYIWVILNGFLASDASVCKRVT